MTDMFGVWQQETHSRVESFVSWCAVSDLLIAIRVHVVITEDISAVGCRCVIHVVEECSKLSMYF